jgi:hypothetical protein
MTKIRSLLKPDEKIMTVGRYDTSTFTTYPPNVEDADTDWVFEFGWNNITLRNSSTYSNLTVVGYGGKSSTVTDHYMVNTQYTLTTYDADKTKVLGQIMYSLNHIYNENPGNDDFREFMVNGKSGIYENVVRVIVDYSTPEGLRRVFFVVKRNQKSLVELLPETPRNILHAPRTLSGQKIKYILK